MKYKSLIVIFILIILGFVYSRFILFNPLKIALPGKSDSLRYEVFWSLIPVGIIEIKLDETALYNGEDAILIKARAETEGLIAKIFNFKADIFSVIDKRSKLPILYREILFKGGEVKEKKILYYDQSKHILKTEGQVYSILPHTYDPLSVVLFLKDKELTPGKKYELNVNSNQSNYRVALMVKSKIIVSKKKLLLLKGLSERRRGEKARHRLSFTLYLTADANIPVMIRAFTPLGYVSGKIKK